MKYFILLLAILSTQSFAVKSRKIVPSLGEPLPVDYSYSDSQSRALSELKGVYKHLLINNTQGAQIACTLAQPTPGVAISTVYLRDKEIVIPANQGYLMDDPGVGTDIFCRSDSGVARTASDPIILQLW